MTDVVFVFGSNLAGRHGKGAALHARKEWEAEYGVGEGLTGRSYAIPTKDEKLNVRSLEDIEKSIDKFLQYATVQHKDYEDPMIFLVTPIGTGLAGYSKKEIAEIFSRKKIPSNVTFTGDWFKKGSYDDAYSKTSR